VNHRAVMSTQFLRRGPCQVKMVFGRHEVIQEPTSARPTISFMISFVPA
jgi:hypothetical protein